MAARYAQQRYSRVRVITARFARRNLDYLHNIANTLPLATLANMGGETFLSEPRYARNIPKILTLATLATGGVLQGGWVGQYLDLIYLSFIFISIYISTSVGFYKLFPLEYTFIQSQSFFSLGLFARRIGPVSALECWTQKCMLSVSAPPFQVTSVPRRVR